MKISAVNANNYNSTAFGVKLSLELRKVLKSEVLAKNKDGLDRLEYKISKVERWGKPDSIIDTKYSPSEALNYITIRKPKMSQRVFVSMTYGESVCGAFDVLTESLIRKSEKLLYDTICLIDN